MEAIDCQAGACCQTQVDDEGFTDCAVKYELMELVVGPTTEIPNVGFDPSPSTPAPSIGSVSLPSPTYSLSSPPTPYPTRCVFSLSL